MEYRADLRNRVAYQIQRNVDQIQIVTKMSWQRTLRLLAVAISIAIALTAIPRGGNSLQFLANGLVVGFVAGYLATVFRDMIAIVERLRR
jgi:preprotein translocase subunit SecF